MSSWVGDSHLGGGGGRLRASSGPDVRDEGLRRRGPSAVEELYDGARPLLQVPRPAFSTAEREDEREGLQQQQQLQQQDEERRQQERRGDRSAGLRPEATGDAGAAAESSGDAGRGEGWCRRNVSFRRAQHVLHLVVAATVWVVLVELASTVFQDARANEADFQRLLFPPGLAPQDSPNQIVNLNKREDVLATVKQFVFVYDVVMADDSVEYYRRDEPLRLLVTTTNTADFLRLEEYWLSEGNLGPFDLPPDNLTDFYSHVHDMTLAFSVDEFQFHDNDRVCLTWSVAYQMTFVSRVQLSGTVTLHPNFCPGQSHAVDFTSNATVGLMVMLLSSIASLCLLAARAFRALLALAADRRRKRRRRERREVRLRRAAASGSDRVSGGNSRRRRRSMRFSSSSDSSGSDGDDRSERGVAGAMADAAMAGLEGAERLLPSSRGSLQTARETLLGDGGGRGDAAGEYGGNGNNGGDDDYYYYYGDDDEDDIEDAEGDTALLLGPRGSSQRGGRGTGGRRRRGRARRRRRGCLSSYWFEEEADLERHFLRWWLVYLFTDLCLIFVSALMIERRISFQKLVSGGVVYLALGLGGGAAYVRLVPGVRALGAKYSSLMATLDLAGPFLGRFTLGVAPIYVGFALCGVQIFGVHSVNFSTLGESVVTLFAITNGDYLWSAFNDLSYLHPWISQLYFIIFMLLFITIISKLILATNEYFYFMTTPATEVIEYEDVVAHASRLAAPRPLVPVGNTKPAPPCTRDIHGMIAVQQGQALAVFSAMAARLGVSPEQARPVFQQLGEEVRQGILRVATRAAECGTVSASKSPPPQ